MKACYKKIKTAMRPGATITSALKSDSKKSSIPEALGSPKPPLHQRHSKCLAPHHMRETCHPNLLRRKRTLSPETITIPPGSLTLAQIRGVPLNVRQIRGSHEDRSSYVINAEQIRSRVPPPLLKRSRSLSPQILRTTPTTDLKSPKLVRSVSNCGSGRGRKAGRDAGTRAGAIPGRDTGIETNYNRALGDRGGRRLNSTGGSSILKQTAIGSGRGREEAGRSTGSTRHGKTASSFRSYIPIKSPPPGRRSGGVVFGRGSGGSPLPLKKTERGGFHRGMMMLHEEDASASMAEYQLQRKKKFNTATAQRHQDHNGSSKPPSKSRLFLQALVGGSMDSQPGSRVLVPPVNHYASSSRPRPPSTLPVMLPRQQVLPQPQQRQYQVPSTLLFRRPLSSANSVFYDQTPKGPRGFGGRQPSGTPSSALFDDDPGIMSEAETSSTGFRRGGKCRSSLPVVRTPSKTLERPLGLVFLQYRSETKRALLPNEITSMDTVKALFVRSFPKQLTLEYLDAMNAKVYIHDNGKDMFYELEDLRDIRGNSVLRLFEPNVNGNGAIPSWDQDQSYFSEPEFDSDFQHQHIHKSKGNKSPYLATYAYPVGATLPRGRPYSPLVPVPAKSVQTGSNSSLPPPKPQRNTVPTYSLVKRSPAGVVAPVPNLVYANPRVVGTNGGQERSSSFPPPMGHFPEGRSRVPADIYSSADTTGGYLSSPERARYISEDPYYYPPPSRSGSITPVIIDEESRFRMEHMERQLANLTGLVQKALIPVPVAPSGGSNPRIQANTLPRNVGATNYSLVQGRDYIPSRDFRDDTDKLSSSSSASLPEERPPNPIDKILAHPKFGKEKSVSFSDDPPELSKQYSPAMHPVEKPSKPAIKCSTLPRMSQVSDRLVLAPVAAQPGKQRSIAPISVTGNGYDKSAYGTYTTSGRELSPEMYNQLRNLQKKAKELKSDVRVLRRNVQAQAHAVRETLRDTFLRFKVVTLAGSDQWMTVGGDPEKVRLKREEDLYRQEMLKLDKDLTDLETTVEELRSHVINKRTRVNMSDVENMALVLSKSSKSVADLKARFPVLQESMRQQLGVEMDRMVGEERFLKDEPDRLEISLRRCKKLTGTLVTLKRLASVQDARTSDSTRSLPSPSPSPSTPTDKMLNRNTGFNVPPASSAPAAWFMVTPNSPAPTNAPENQLDALLDELNQQQPSTAQRNRLNPPEPPKRLPSYPSTESGGSPVRHPPLPPKPTKIPPPPPPRSSSKNSPLISPRLSAIDSDSTESLNSQDGRSGSEDKLSQRHQELLRKQKLLQDQYLRLQLLQDKKGSNSVGTGGKKISESGGGGGTGRLSVHNNGSASIGREESSPIPGGGVENSLNNLTMANETDIL